MDYHLIVVLHRITVSLFLLHYVWKGYLLLADKTEALSGYTAKTKVAEMVLSVGFLGTGIYLGLFGPPLAAMQWVKIGMVFASIPLAVVGFKRGKKMLAILSILLLVGAYGLAEMNKAHNKKVNTTATAQEVYKEKCTRCHGDAGDAMISGAKNLKITTLSDDQLKSVIKNGVPNTQMAGYADLTDEQLNGLVAYVKSLKQ